MKVIFALRSNEINKLFYEKKDFLEAIETVTNPYVKTFKFEDEHLARQFLELSDENEALRLIEKENKKKLRIQRKLNEEAEMKKFRDTPYVPILHHDGKNICFLDVEAGKNKAISIGFVIVDTEQDEIIDEYYSLLKPVDFTGVDEFCEHLTGILTEDVEVARNFDEVYEESQKLLDKHQVSNVFTWGNSDIKFLRNSVPKNTTYPFFSSIKNIQWIISKVSYGYYRNSQWSLENIVKILKISSSPVAHNSLLDAKD